MPAMVRNKISRFESLARRLVEGSVGRIVGNDGLALQIATQLARALEENPDLGGQTAAFDIAVNPADLRAMGPRVEELEARLARYVTSLNQTATLSRSRKVRVKLIPDETVQRGAVTIELAGGPSVDDTTDVMSKVVADSLRQLQLLDAFLIVNGRRHVELDKPFIRVGRRTDNDVIIDSPVVSRQHAHIRWRNGRFVIYDVGSRGGIQVNGARVTESVLAAGDLIMLSERVPLIYGEGLESRQSLHATTYQTQDTLTYSVEED